MIRTERPGGNAPDDMIQDSNSRIILHGEDDEELSCYVVAQTVLGGRTYLLTTDVDTGDGEALILRDDSEPGDEDGLYSVVEDETELERAAEAFGDLLEDEDIELR